MNFDAILNFWCARGLAQSQNYFLRTESFFIRQNKFILFGPSRLKTTFHHPFSLKISVHSLILLLHQLHSDKYFFRHSDDCHRGSKYRFSLLHQHINKLTSALFALLRSADQNGFCAGNVTEIVLELRSATRELITTPTATAAVAEADVVGRRQAVSTRSCNAGGSTIVYVTGTSAKVIDSVGTERNNCV